MFTILLHSSKTIRMPGKSIAPYQAPKLIAQAEELAVYIKSLPATQIANSMHLSPKMTNKVHDIWQDWSKEPEKQLSAIDAFIGDIYSGLQVQTFSAADRSYANDNLVILSGLYGALRALDGIAPYRLEMAYKFPQMPYDNLYKFWGNTIANTLPTSRTVINLSAVEYTKTVLPYLHGTLVISPKFMTMDAGGKPVFVTVHAKVARGAFAHWLIKNRIIDETEMQNFNELDYRYDSKLSSPEIPIFIAKSFGGLGLSIRLS